MKKSTLLFIGICIIGSIFHAYFFSLNEVMKIADSFAYLQMSYYLEHFSSEGLGSGWFGFIYSLPIALLNLFGDNDFLAAKIVNILLWNISVFFLWKLSTKILNERFSLLLVILYFLSASLISFHIHILSENIYIPLFLCLFLSIYTLIEEIPVIASPSLRFSRQKRQIIQIAVLLGLLYLTRAEAFIYILSVGLLALLLLLQKKLSFSHFFHLGILFFLSFFVFIAPYLWHLHTITGEWGLTNKGASNLRQAELRGIETMDDAGFEQAVAELTPDKKHLIAGFAGGMKYEAPQIEGSLSKTLSENPKKVLARIGENQKKLFLKNIPEIFLGDAVKLYSSGDARFGGNLVFLIWMLLPFGVLLFGFMKIFQKERVFLSIMFAFFLPACFFFTLFFTLNRYFIIFLPLLLLVYTYGLSHIYRSSRVLFLFLLGNIISLLLLSCLVYWNTESVKDEQYRLKQEAGLWLQEYIGNNIKENSSLDIMERFPIVTYYSGMKTRWITPYTDTAEDIRIYALSQGIELLVVDTMDFLTYRPKLAKLLEETPEGFSKLKEFSNEKGEKVILYLVKK